MPVAHRASCRTRTERAAPGSRLPLVLGALVTVVAAIVFDVLAGEHPTRTPSRSRWWPSR
jgi:hypothetical protein